MSLARELASSISATAVTSTNAMEWRGPAGTGTASAGVLKLTTAEESVVDADQLGRIDFSAPKETGADALLVGASIYAEADGTFGAAVNATELVFATGASEVAGERMRVTSDGKLGIGVSTPASQLDVRGTMQVGVNNAGHDVKFYGTSDGAFLEYDKSSDELEIRGGAALPGLLTLSTREASVVDGNKLGQIDFQAPLEATGGTSSDQRLVAASIWAEADATFSATVNDTDLVFATGLSEVATEKMRITSGGNVGIGTVAPVSQFHVVGSGTNTELKLDNTDGDDVRLFCYDQTNAGNQFGISKNGMGGFIIESNTLGVIGSTSNVPLLFATNATEKMRILVGGNVGIGTVAPARKLHVTGTGGDNALMRIECATSNVAGIELLSGHGNWGIYNSDTVADALEFTDDSASAIRMFIDSTGKVGIGTTTPVTDLTIDGTLTLKEQADADGDTTAYGQIWVNTATPNELYFTGDTGVDIQLTTATGINAASTGKAIAMAMVFGG